MKLSRQEIARAGLRLLNEVGLNGLTLRLIADELGVKAPALYWHVKNKQELLDEMATQMYRDATDLVLDQNKDWEAALADLARAFRRMMLRYRDGAKVFSGTYFTDAELPHERPLRQLVEAGLKPQDALRVILTLNSYIVGFTIEEQAVYPLPGERDERYDAKIEERSRHVESDVLEALAGGLLPGDADERFDDGIDTILAGFRARLGGAWPK